MTADGGVFCTALQRCSRDGGERVSEGEPQRTRHKSESSPRYGLSQPVTGWCFHFFLVFVLLPCCSQLVDAPSRKARLVPAQCPQACPQPARCKNIAFLRILCDACKKRKNTLVFSIFYALHIESQSAVFLHRAGCGQACGH